LTTKGARFIFEALAGNDIDAIDPFWWLAPNANGFPQFIDLEPIKKNLEDIKTRLSKRSRILVGHNLFTDLAFLYQTFIGDLPENHVEFAQNINNHWKTVIDTKYLATCGNESNNGNSSLKEIWRSVQDQKYPIIEMAKGFRIYGPEGKDHEAGYDSKCSLLMIVENFSKISESNILYRLDDSRSTYQTLH
jgi:poly(A)-specific ribonuclease